MQNQKKEHSKHVDENGINPLEFTEESDPPYTEEDRKQEAFNKAIGIICRYLSEQGKINEFITFHNKPNEGVQTELTIHLHTRFIGTNEQLKQKLEEIENGKEE